MCTGLCVHRGARQQMLTDPRFERVQLGATPIKGTFLRRYFCRRSLTPNGRLITDAPNLLSTLETSLALIDFTAARYLIKMCVRIAVIQATRTSVSHCIVHSVRRRQLQAQRRAWLTPQFYRSRQEGCRCSDVFSLCTIPLLLWLKIL